MTDTTLPHYSPTLQVVGSSAKLHVPVPPSPVPRGGRRGTVRQTIRSAASRRRQSSFLASLDWKTIVHEHVVRFVTLTTPPECWHFTQADYFRSLEVFKRWVRGMGGWACVAKEQGRHYGQWHYHALCVFPCRIDTEKPDDSQVLARQGVVGRLWTDALRSPRPVRVEVAPVDNVDGVIKYISNYISKAVYAPDWVHEAYDGARPAEFMSMDGPVNGSGDVVGDAPLFKAHNGKQGPETPANIDHNGNRWWWVVCKSRCMFGEKCRFVLTSKGLKLVYALRRRIRRLWAEYDTRKLAYKALEQWPELLQRLACEGSSALRGIYEGLCGVGSWEALRHKCVKSRKYRYLRRAGGFELFISPQELWLALCTVDGVGSDDFQLVAWSGDGVGVTEETDAHNGFECSGGHDTVNQDADDYGDGLRSLRVYKQWIGSTHG